MSEFVTISKADKLFKDYMLGNVPNRPNFIAVPVRGFNGDFGKEQTTFQLIDRSTKKRPMFFYLSGQLIRWKWLTISLSPVVTAFAYLSFIGFEYSALTFFLVLITLFFSHSSIFILNDFYDHLFGVDTARSKGGSRVIQKAWLPASTVRSIGYTFLILSVICGLFLSYQHGWNVLLLGAVGLFSGWVYSYLSKFKRFIGLNILMITFFMGPFLVVGVSWGLFNYTSTGLIFMGALFGLLAYLCIGFRHMENLYLSHRAVGTSLVEYLGFDKSKWFLLSCVLAVPFVYVLVVFDFTTLSHSIDHLTSSVLLILPLFFYVYILQATIKLSSSMGSSIVKLRNSLSLLHFVVGTSFLLYLTFLA